MASLFEKMNPSQTPAAAGTAGYQQNIVSNAATQLRPQYDQAIKKARQSLSNRGMLRGGLVQEAESGIGEQYRGRLSDIASGAATHSADLGEASRVREQQRGWQVEDIMRAMEERRRMGEEQRADAERQQWADLIGGTAQTAGTVLGTMYGGPAGGAAANQGIGALRKQFAPPDEYEMEAYNLPY